MNNQVLLEVAGIRKNYKNRTVLDIIDLKVDKGECIALIGNNGAGKTTLIKAIVDLISIDSGSVVFNGKDIKNTEEWKKFISIYLETNFLIPFLTPKEYLHLVGSMKDVSIQEMDQFIDEVKSFSAGELFDTKKKYIRELSKGNQQKTGLLSALAGNKELIILDEPYANLDISSKKKLSHLISKINTTKKSTFIISSHNLDEVLDVSNVSIRATTL